MRTVPHDTFLEKANYLKYVKFTGVHHLILTMFESLLLYGNQTFIDEPYSILTKEINKKAFKI